MSAGKWVSKIKEKACGCAACYVVTAFYSLWIFTNSIQVLFQNLHAKPGCFGRRMWREIISHLEVFLPGFFTKENQSKVLGQGQRTAHPP
jgi:hypothetical protein